MMSKPIHEGVLFQKRYDAAHEGKECHLIGEDQSRSLHASKSATPDRWFVVIVARDKHKTYQLSKTE
jgi:tRNA U34 2-thiouridine synthase MnmA/TrmU